MPIRIIPTHSSSGGGTVSGLRVLHKGDGAAVAAPVRNPRIHAHILIQDVVAVLRLHADMARDGLLERSRVLPLCIAEFLLTEAVTVCCPFAQMQCKVKALVASVVLRQGECKDAIPACPVWERIAASPSCPTSGRPSLRRYPHRSLRPHTFLPPAPDRGIRTGAFFTRKARNRVFSRDGLPAGHDLCYTVYNGFVQIS